MKNRLLAKCNVIEDKFSVLTHTIHCISLPTQPALKRCLIKISMLTISQKLT